MGTELDLWILCVIPIQNGVTGGGGPLRGSFTEHERGYRNLLRGIEAHRDSHMGQGEWVFAATSESMAVGEAVAKGCPLGGREAVDFGRGRQALPISGQQEGMKLINSLPPLLTPMPPVGQI